MPYIPFNRVCVWGRDYKTLKTEIYVGGNLPFCFEHALVIWSLEKVELVALE